MKIFTSTILEDPVLLQRRYSIPNFFILFLFVSIFLLPLRSLSQNLPPAGDCVSNDLELIGAELIGFDDCFQCEPGSTFDATLELTLFNKTGSTRTAFAFWATLEVTDEEGNTTSELISGCGGPV